MTCTQSFLHGSVLRVANQACAKTLQFQNSDALRDLVPFAQVKTSEKRPWRSVTGYCYGHYMSF